MYLAIQPFSFYPSGLIGFLHPFHRTGVANNLIQGSDSVFSTGAIPFSNSSGKLTTSLSNFYYDDTNNRLGLGTASPTTTFDVVGLSKMTYSGATAGTRVLKIDH